MGEILFLDLRPRRLKYGGVISRNKLSEEEKFEFGKMLIPLSACWLQCDSVEGIVNIVDIVENILWAAGNIRIWI